MDTVGISPEKQEGLHWEHKQLLYQVGYYALVLENVHLSDEWRGLYQERLTELQEKLNTYEQA